MGFAGQLFNEPSLRLETSPLTLLASYWTSCGGRGVGKGFLRSNNCSFGNDVIPKEGAQNLCTFGIKYFLQEHWWWCFICRSYGDAYYWGKLAVHSFEDTWQESAMNIPRQKRSPPTPLFRCVSSLLWLLRFFLPCHSVKCFWEQWYWWSSLSKTMWWRLIYCVRLMLWTSCELTTSRKVVRCNVTPSHKNNNYTSFLLCERSLVFLKGGVGLGCFLTLAICSLIVSMFMFKDLFKGFKLLPLWWFSVFMQSSLVRFT